jgi:hypothetical protein
MLIAEAEKKRIAAKGSVGIEGQERARNSPAYMRFFIPK